MQRCALLVLRYIEGRKVLFSLFCSVSKQRCEQSRGRLDIATAALQHLTTYPAAATVACGEHHLHVTSGYTGIKQEGRLFLILKMESPGAGCIWVWDGHWHHRARTTSSAIEPGGLACNVPTTVPPDDTRSTLPQSPAWCKRYASSAFPQAGPITFLQIALALCFSQWWQACPLQSSFEPHGTFRT